MPTFDRRFAALALAAMLAATAVTGVRAQAYPAKPIRIVVGFAAGGSTDVIARLTAQRLAEPLGQPVVVENRLGATGAIADEHVARAAPDGYTLLVNAGSSAITPALRRLPYDLERDLTPISLVATVPFVLVVHPSLPVHTVQQLVALARTRKGELSYGSSGVGGAHHLAGELFNAMAGVSIAHIPFKGGAENAIATASGQIEMSYATPTAALPLLQSRRLRALAVTSARRASSLPSVPTLHESGLAGYDRPNWNGLLGPAGLPRGIVARVNAAVVKELETKSARDAFGAQGLEVQTSTPEEFAAFLRRQLAENAKLVRLAGVKAE